MSHDRCCPGTDPDPVDCPVCAAISAARAEEKQAFSHTWKVNLPLISRRCYDEGYTDRAERRPNKYDR